MAAYVGLCYIYTAAFFHCVTLKPCVLLCIDRKSSGNKCACLRVIGQVIQQKNIQIGASYPSPLIGRWWWHHSEECVPGRSCSRDRGFVSFPFARPRDPFSTQLYVYEKVKACLPTSKSQHCECLLNSVLGKGSCIMPAPFGTKVKLCGEVTSTMSTTSIS